MSHDELLAEYERLKALAERLQAENTALQEQIKAQKEEYERLAEVQVQIKEDYERRLAEAQAQIEELRKQLFGPKADRLTPEQEEQLKQLNQDLQDEAQARRRPVIKSSKTKIEPAAVGVSVSSVSAALYQSTWKPRRLRSNRK